MAIPHGTQEELSPKALRRFFSKILIGDDCWDWIGTVLADGYGQFHVSKDDRRKPHRIAYEVLVGPIPDGLPLDHLCRNRRCVKPTHLEPVTTKENLARGEGFIGVNARKTHCAHGHEFTPENTYHPPKRPDRRHCRVCQQERSRRTKGA